MNGLTALMMAVSGAMVCWRHCRSDAVKAVCKQGWNGSVSAWNGVGVGGGGRTYISHDCQAEASGKSRRRGRERVTKSRNNFFEVSEISKLR